LPRSVEEFMESRLLELPAGCYLERASNSLVLRKPDGTLVGELVNVTNGDVRGEAPTLRVNFFGDFEVLCGRAPVPLGRNRKAVAILKYMVFHRPRPVSQDCLMAWLWPDSNLRHARWSLNSAIYALRKILGECAVSVAPHDAVIFEKGAYRLSPSMKISADAGEFDAFHEKGRKLEKSGGIPDADKEYERAVALYRGDFLVEDLYEEWTEIERGRLIDAYTAMLGSLAVHRMERGEYRECMDFCYRILEKDRCCERTHRLLMECFARLGQRGRALRQYGMCERSLAGAWDAEPSPETRAIYSGILEEHSEKEER